MENYGARECTAMEAGVETPQISLIKTIINLKDRIDEVINKANSIYQYITGAPHLYSPKQDKQADPKNNIEILNVLIESIKYDQVNTLNDIINSIGKEISKLGFPTK